MGHLQVKHQLDGLWLYPSLLRLKAMVCHTQTSHMALKVDVKLTDQVVIKCDHCEFKCRLNIQLKKHKQTTHAPENNECRFKCSWYRNMKVKWNKLNGGGPQGGLMGILEYLSKTNHNTDFILLMTTLNSFMICQFLR